MRRSSAPGSYLADREYRTERPGQRDGAIQIARLGLLEVIAEPAVRAICAERERADGERPRRDVVPAVSLQHCDHARGGYGQTRHPGTCPWGCRIHAGSTSGVRGGMLMLRQKRLAGS